MATIECSDGVCYNRSQALGFLLCLPVYIVFVYPNSSLDVEQQHTDNG